MWALEAKGSMTMPPCWLLLTWTLHCVTGLWGVSDHTPNTNTTNLDWLMDARGSVTKPPHTDPTDIDTHLCDRGEGVSDHTPHTDPTGQHGCDVSHGADSLRAILHVLLGQPQHVLCHVTTGVHCRIVLSQKGKVKVSSSTVSSL